jgi:hypothetical protein
MPPIEGGRLDVIGFWNNRQPTPMGRLFFFFLGMTKIKVMMSVNALIVNPTLVNTSAKASAMVMLPPPFFRDGQTALMQL